MERGCRRTTRFHLLAHCAQVFRQYLVQEPLPKGWQDIALKNRAAHGAGAISHPRILQPALAKFTETLSFLDAALLASLFEGRRDAILNHQLGFDQLLTGARKRNARFTVPANDHRFPAPV